MEQNNNEIIDISSGYSAPAKSSGSNPVNTYSEGIFRHIGTIIKAISFIVAFGIIIISLVAAYFISICLFFTEWDKFSPKTSKF